MYSNFLLPILTGLFLSFSFRYDIGFLFAGIAFVPVLFSFQDIPENKKRFINNVNMKNAGKAFLSGLIFYLFSIFWLSKTSVYGYILLSIYLSFYFYVFGFFYNILKKHILLSALLWTVLEVIRGYLFTGFPWIQLGVSQHANIYFVQIASLIGAYGISFLIVLGNLIIFNFIKFIYLNKKEKIVNVFNKKSGRHFVCFMLLIGFIYLYGYLRINKDVYHKSSDNVHNLKIGMVSSEIPLEIKWNPKFVQPILKEYIDSTRKLKKEKCDLIIWPETAIPDYLNHVGEIYYPISALVRELNSFLLVGAPEYKIDRHKNKKYYNSQFYFSSKGDIIGEYDKIKPVPFGEYTPLASYLFFLKNFTQGIAEFSKGDEYTIFTCKEFRFASLICYENIFPGLVKKFATQNIDFIVSVSNDAWFYLEESYQHIYISKLRAIEFGIPIIRVANMGVSCVIDKYGRVYNLKQGEGVGTYVLKKR